MFHAEYRIGWFSNTSLAIFLDDSDSKRTAHPSSIHLGIAWPTIVALTMWSTSCGMQSLMASVLVPPTLTENDFAVPPEKVKVLVPDGRVFSFHVIGHGHFQSFNFEPVQYSADRILEDSAVLTSSGSPEKLAASVTPHKATIIVAVRVFMFFPLVPYFRERRPVVGPVVFLEDCLFLIVKVVASCGFLPESNHSASSRRLEYSDNSPNSSSKETWSQHLNDCNCYSGHSFGSASGSSFLP